MLLAEIADNILEYVKREINQIPIRSRMDVLTDVMDKLNSFRWSISEETSDECE